MRESGEPVIAGKITVRAGGRKVVLRKHVGESERHVLLKALVFALYVPDYPNLVIEPPRSGRYKPDLLATDGDDGLVFWAECGETGRDKLGWLLKHQPDAHLVFARQGIPLDPWRALVESLATDIRRSAPVDLVLVPRDADRFVAADGEITVRREDVTIARLDAR